MKIKKSQAALGLAALVVISTVGMASVTLAAGKNHSNNSSATSTAMRLEHGNKLSLTDAQKTKMDAKRTAVEAALKANNYNAWVTAVGANAPILQKVNANNFSRYVQLYNLRQQENVIATELGLTKGNGNGMGMGLGRGMGLGLGLGQK